MTGNGEHTNYLCDWGMLYYGYTMLYYVILTFTPLRGSIEYIEPELIAGGNIISLSSLCKYCHQHTAPEETQQSLVLKVVGSVLETLGMDHQTASVNHQNMVNKNCKSTTKNGAQWTLAVFS